MVWGPLQQNRELLVASSALTTELHGGANIHPWRGSNPRPLDFMSKRLFCCELPVRWSASSLMNPAA
eukprot:3946030-Prymnesium_polylepis.1